MRSLKHYEQGTKGKMTAFGTSPKGRYKHIVFVRKTVPTLEKIGNSAKILKVLSKTHEKNYGLRILKGR
jgi:hypothetical protein